MKRFRRSSAAVALGALALGCAGAFYAGGELQARLTPAARSGARLVSGAAARGDDSTVANVGRASSTVELGRLGSALSTAMRSHAAGEAPSQAYVETPEQRAERHRTIDRKLTETLGEISPAKRAALLEFNDEAWQVQLGLQGAVLNGALSQADYDEQLHQRIMVQLEQLRTIVDDDEYRKLTGLEPGVDPYEFMRTGVGAAAGTPEPSAVAEK